METVIALSETFGKLHKSPRMINDRVPEVLAEKKEKKCSYYDGLLLKINDSMT